MYDIIIIVFYILFFLIGLWRRSLIMVVFNTINTLAFYVEYQNTTMTLILLIGLIAQTLLTLSRD